MELKLDPKNKSYQSYLLRVWKDDEKEGWRALLVTIPTQEQRHFASLEALFTFLHEQQISPDTLLQQPGPTQLSPQFS